VDAGGDPAAFAFPERLRLFVREFLDHAASLAGARRGVKGDLQGFGIV
jgi:hypothetical protein